MHTGIDRFRTKMFITHVPFNDYKPRDNKFPLDPAIAICRQATVNILAENANLFLTPF